jgi:two-component system, NarL family, invasion response regulator UvrY
MIKVALVDDHILMRVGMKEMLNCDGEYSVVAEGQSGEDAIGICKREKFDVMTLDINMPGGLSGIDALVRIQRIKPDVRILMVSQHTDLALIRMLLDKGASGYLSKTAGAEELKKAIRTIHLGRRYVESTIAQSMALSTQLQSHALIDALSAREVEVMIATVNGIGNKELSKRLHVTGKTISTFKSRIHEKLGTKTEIELVRLAIAHGLVPDVFVPSKRELTSDSSA